MGICRAWGYGTWEYGGMGHGDGPACQGTGGGTACRDNSLMCAQGGRCGVEGLTMRIAPSRQHLLPGILSPRPPYST